MPRFSPFVLLLAACTLFSCSTGAGDYKKIQEEEQRINTIMNRTRDFDSLLAACNEMIGALEEFNRHHPAGQWTSSTNVSLATWKTIRESIQSDRATLIAGLYKKTQNAATDAAKEHWRSLGISGVILEAKNEQRIGAHICLDATYRIQVQGLMQSAERYKVRVKSQMAMDTKEITFTGAPEIVE